MTVRSQPLDTSVTSAPGDLWLAAVDGPSSSVPDPSGEHESWAGQFKEPLRESLDRLHGPPPRGGKGSCPQEC